MTPLGGMSVPEAIGLFLGCAAVIGLVGTRLARVVDELADRTGLGEAVAGAVLLGMATSLSGIVVSVSAAAAGRPELAMSNALGGIAVQTLFLAVADMAHRRANLEHAAASLGNLIQGALLISLLGVLMLGRFSPEWTVVGIHPATILLFAIYFFGLRLVRKTQANPMWAPARTSETRVDEPDPDSSDRSTRRLWTSFVLFALALAGSGWLLEQSAGVISDETALGEAAVGVLLTAVATSLPELVTTVTAVRRGALTMAVAGIIGGNSFDTLFAGAADIAYRDGSIYHAVPDEVSLWVAVSLLMTTAVLMGLIRREEQGPGRIGFESVSVLALYGGGVAVVVLAGS